MMKSNMEYINEFQKARIEKTCEGMNCSDIVPNQWEAGMYEQEVSTDLFVELENSLKYLPDYPKVYHFYNKVFRKCLDRNIPGDKLNLGGTFAKTDFLLKKYHAPRELVRGTNDTRVRLRKRQQILVEDLEKWYLYDLRNLCRFIAFVCHVGVPASLESLFPVSEEEVYVPVLLGECMRMIVDTWDEEYIYGTAEESVEGEVVKVCYAHGNRAYDYDWTYLYEMFYRGVQINLVRPRESDGVIFPELIVFEPDYLVDISTVAKCFTNYAESPYVHLVDKLRPSPASEAIVLGNFAGQLLDEEIHRVSHSRSYKESVSEFWQHHAVSLLSAGIGPNFHNEASLQKANISRAMRHMLPQYVSDFHPEEGMVEPSFFSEMLGLQGRMDYLQMDYKVLIEQKSGKGEYPYDHFVKPKYKEEHYVQMLLYMMLIRYNFRETYEENHQELNAFLLYSKYKEGLLGLGFAPELIFRAMKVRNGLAWMEMLAAREDGIRILDRLTPEKMNMKQASNALWTRFQRNQIAEVLAPVHQATELERAYFYRFMTFLSQEHVLSKLGNGTKENSGFASKWYDSLEEKLQAGNIYDRLTLVYPDSMTEGNVKNVKLRFSEDEENGMSNFRVGDIVILYPYEKNSEPDVRKTMVFRCTVEGVGADEIELALRAAQSDPTVFLRSKDKVWAIEHDFMESSFSPLYRAMHAFLSAPQSRKDLLLFQREPEVDASVAVTHDYGDFSELSVKVKRAKDLFLIIGPPGTGKTSYGLLNTLQEELTDSTASVLLLSYTNRAVDEICSKLHEKDIDFVRIGNKLTCAHEYRDKLLSERAKNCRNMGELMQIVQTTRVFVATTTAMNSNVALFQIKQFTLSIIDEASQILEPHLIGIFSAHNNGVPAVRKFVLIGDDKQLPAVVQQSPETSKVQDAALNGILLKDCRLSLFERMLQKYRKNGNVVYMLKRQGRMHRDIALFPNCVFYNNRLEEVPKSHQHVALPWIGNSANGIDNLLQTRRIVFLHADSPVDSVSDKVNQTEADLIAATVLRIYEKEKEHFDVEKTVGVIVPYRNQIATVRNTIGKAGLEVLSHITIDTVERYQGSQRKYIIYGFTVQKYYQLDFLTNHVFEDWDGNVIDRKLNVAMTRAEEHLLLVGNAGLLSNNLTFFKLIEFVKSVHGYFDVPPDKYVAGAFQVPPFAPDGMDWGSASFDVTPAFANAFDKWVLQPVRKASGQEWPAKVLGHDPFVNLNAIGYGRTGFSGRTILCDETVMSPSCQVLLYCYYLMRRYYCSCRVLYVRHKDWIEKNICSVDGRLRFVDVGCGPATCGIAFAELFRKLAPDMEYTGIESSPEMKAMAEKLLDDVFAGNLCYRMADTWDVLEQCAEEDASRQPAMIVINLSYFFPGISTGFAERLAYRMVDVVQKHPNHKYVLFIQQSETDRELHSFKVFRKIIAPFFSVLKEEKASFSCTMGRKECTLDFYYGILTNS